VAFSLYLIGLLGLGYVLHFSPLKENVSYKLGKVMDLKMHDESQNMAFYQNFALVFHDIGLYRDARDAYEQILRLEPNQAMALNNLAWLLATVPDEDIRDPIRALSLARRAVEIERSPVFLDTLAEAYYANGQIEDALASIDEAAALDQDGHRYYEKQRHKYLTAPDRE
jgi:tetratricopeptide (TPR) repeat protein